MHNTILVFDKRRLDSEQETEKMSCFRRVDGIFYCFPKNSFLLENLDDEKIKHISQFLNPSRGQI
jgi:hypothetical protein